MTSDIFSGLATPKPFETNQSTSRAVHMCMERDTPLIERAFALSDTLNVRTLVSVGNRVRITVE